MTDAPDNLTESQEGTPQRDPLPNRTQPIMSRRQRLVTFFLPWLGLLAMMPPFVHVVGQHDVAGIPAIVIYLFAIWTVLIVIAFALNRHAVTASAAPNSPQNGPRS